MGNKIQCFEYILYQLISWYKELRPTDVSLLSFTRLKVLKLLFFVSVVRQEDEPDLLDIFNNFYAMQHGPVESDIYTAMTASTLQHYKFKSRSIEVGSVREQDFQFLDSNIRNRIVNSINLLRQQNKNIVTYTASQLVNLSHKWDSWKMSMHIAEVEDKGSAPMNVDLIRSDKQYFVL